MIDYTQHLTLCQYLSEKEKQKEREERKESKKATAVFFLTDGPNGWYSLLPSVPYNNTPTPTPTVPYRM